MEANFDLGQLDGVTSAAQVVAKRYRELTGKPLGITGEIGELIAARLLGLELAEARQAGYDALRSDGTRIQIKTRCVLPDSKPGQRVGRIKLQHEWDTVALLLVNEDFEPLAIYEAERDAVEQALLEPGSRSRNERGALSISKFKAISRLVWSAEDSRPASQ
jgi:hypothetical protein